MIVRFLIFKDKAYAAALLTVFCSLIFIANSAPIQHLRKSKGSVVGVYDNLNRGFSVVVHEI